MNIFKMINTKITNIYIKAESHHALFSLSTFDIIADNITIIEVNFE